MAGKKLPLLVIEKAKDQEVSLVQEALLWNITGQD